MEKILERCDAQNAGETLGRGAIEPRVLVRMGMDSNGRRVVLLRPRARRIGLVVQRDKYGRWVTTSDFMRP